MGENEPFLLIKDIPMKAASVMKSNVLLFCLNKTKEGNTILGPLTHSGALTELVHLAKILTKDSHYIENMT